MTGTCQGCGTELAPNKAPGPSRKWCSDRCRRHTVYSRPCLDCGRPTYNGTNPPPERCTRCANHARKFWTKEAIVGAIQAWADDYGEPPSATEWRWKYSDAYPSLRCVQDAFGSWNLAIEAAGCTPRPMGHYGRPGEDPVLCAEIRARYEAGESTIALAAAYGCSAEAIGYRVRKAGGVLRDGYEAQALRKAAA